MTNNIKVKNIILTTVTSLLIISVSINIFQAGNKYALKADTDTARLKADSLLSVKLLIEKEYNDAILDLDSYKGKYDEVDQLLANSRNEIISYKKKIDHLQKDNANIKTLREQLKHLKSMKESFEMQVSALVKTKEDLENELSSSNQQNFAMRQELNDLNRKIELAKALTAQNITVKWIKVKNGKSIETNRPRRANHLEISFDINNNPFAPVGEKNILVSLYDPKGQLVKNSKSGRNYSFAKPFKYEQKPEQVVMYVDLQQKPLKGKYKLEVMIDGNSGSKYEFTLLNDMEIEQVMQEI